MVVGSNARDVTIDKFQVGIVELSLDITALDSGLASQSDVTIDKFQFGARIMPALDSGLAVSAAESVVSACNRDRL